MRKTIKYCSKGHFKVAGEIEIQLNPMERTLFLLYLRHPEGIASDNLLLHWKELCSIYEKESVFDDTDLREARLESLCGESKMVFYGLISSIKRHFCRALGARRAMPYYIRRDKNGIYRTRATLES